MELYNETGLEPLISLISLLIFASCSLINIYVLLKYRHFLTEYYISTVHAVFASIYGFIGYNSSGFVDDKLLIFVICGNVTLAYFLTDLTNIIAKTNKNNLRNNMLFIVHHIVFSLIIFWMIQSGKYHTFGCAVIFTELSTIFLNSFHFLKYYSLTRSELKKYIKVQICVFAIVYFLVRVVFLTYIVIDNSYLIMMDSTLLLCAIFTLGLNYYWFYRLIRKIVDVL